MQAFTPLEAGDPEQVGPYRIVGRLGSGGMGRVYLARSPGGRATAVKVVHEELAGDAGFRRRFAREAAAARRVTGPFTAPVVDADPDADLPWLATAHVPGVPLGAAVAAHGGWPEQCVRALGSGLAEALEAIHRAHVVHRDLKPSNVLLAPDGPRVIDFGISVTADDTKLTTTGATVGSPGYLPPEQLVGGEVGPAGDVFALGALLVYAANGTGAFGGGPAYGVNYRVVHEDPDLTGLPDGLAEVVARCLAKDPSARPGTLELVVELGRWEKAGDTFSGSGWLPGPVAAEVAAAQAAPPPETPAPPAGDSGPVPASAELPTVTVDSAPQTSVATARLGAIGPPFATGRRRTTVLAVAGALAVLAVVAALLLPRAFSGDGTANGGSGSAQPAAAQLSVRQQWAHDEEFTGRPVVTDGTVVVDRMERGLHAVDTDSGDTVWTYDELSGATLEGLSDGLLVVSGRENGTVQAIDPDDGKRVWSVPAAAHTPPGMKWNLYLRVVVADGTVFVNTMYHPPEGDERFGVYALSAVDAATGRLKWTRPVKSGLAHALTVQDGVVYAGEWDFKGSYFYALDADTGDRRWRYRAAKSRGHEATAITVAGDTVYMGDSNGVLHALDARHGTRKWTYEPDVQSHEWLEPLLVTDGVILGATGESAGTTGPGEVHAVTAVTGKPRWTEATDGEPVLHGVQDGAVRFSTQTGTLHTADVRTGEAASRTQLASGDADAAVDGDRVYFDGGDGRLHAGRISVTRK